ncbi:VanZ family protein [Hahella ganghwensis]|uniref:VanZ family protein n=1 Tax=Hahella ganghwensis TaxID=286420 RepID=UPI00038275CF|nr:VanZ family protein [Hahella ganghwensis]
MQRLSDAIKQTLSLLSRSRLSSVMVYALLAVGYLSAIVPAKYTPVATLNDKLVHLCAFAGLFVLLRVTHRQLHLTTLVVGLLSYGLAVEIHQWFLPFRSFSLADLLADAIGIMIGMFVSHNLLKIEKSTANPSPTPTQPNQ